MSSSKVYMLIMLKKLTNKVECRPELIHFLRHRVDGDDHVILMLPRGLTTEGNPSTGWAIPYVVHLEIADEEGRGLTGKLAISSSMANSARGGLSLGFSREGEGDCGGECRCEQSIDCSCSQLMEVEGSIILAP